MATGNITVRHTKNGETRYEITVEGERNKLTGKRNRVFNTIKGSRREANAEMHSMITEMEKGKAMKASPITIAQWMDTWLDLYIPNVEETTKVGYKTKIRCYIKPALGNIMMKSLRTEHVQRMVNDMLERGLSPKNIRDTYNNINVAMKKAVTLLMFPYNPCEGVVLPKLKRYKAKVYDLKMIHQLLDTAEGTDMYLPILLCVTVGLRRGELLALRWENIDFEHNILKVRSNLVRGEDGFIIKAPKSEAGIRDIQIGNEVISELLKEKERYAEDKAELGALFQDNAFIIRQKHGAPMTPDAMSRKWKRFIQAHDLPNIRFHALRHSNATALIQAGVNPRVVQQRLGHSDVSITLNTYTHVLPEMDKDAAQKLDAIMIHR